MWIALGIIGFLAALITVILLLPVKVIIKNNENNELILRYKFLWKTFGEHLDPNDPIIRTLKNLSGYERLERNVMRTERLSGEELKKTLAESYDILVDFLKEILGLLRRATIRKLHITIRCTGDEPDRVAITYGQCCTVTYGLLNTLRSVMKLRSRGCKIDVGCDFPGEKPVFRYDALLVVRAGNVLAALWRTVMAEAKRIGEKKQNQPK